MSDFYHSYTGNKRNELNEIEDMIHLDRFDTIAEPFGGSLAFSRYMYKQEPSKKFLVGDIDEDLTFFCNNFYKHKVEVLERTKKDIKDCSTKDEYNKYIKNKPSQDDVVCFLTWYLFYNKYYNIRQGLFPTVKGAPKFVKYLEKTSEADEFFKNVTYHNDNYKAIFDNVKDDEKALVFLDPPYFMTNCDFYKTHNIKQIWTDIIKFTRTCKCKYIFVHESTFITDHIFNDNIVKKYNKNYITSSRNTTHCVISNI